ncbi:hypothetical protein DLAC_01754 [Tieghemostelium lacteum]|uniref:Uncharacterized protein n=1 Tax=Tieghemostelium lacteum TaxID=361077 RepID=A0A152A6K5_TIELA|nr:hypothetical protein DLAC_01754 [Tieghemostelium lacteum]|eukprot:KYR01745.1 hypothetical protein DLAC_01754 [Tieghemostelium lacteum]
MIWKWSGTSIAEGICKLVLTFHKLSNEVGDTGEVKGVLFEAPITNTSALNILNTSNSIPITGSNSNSTTTTTTSTSPTTVTPTTTTTNVRHSYHARTPSTTGSSSTAKRIKPVNQAPPIRLSCEKDENSKVTASVFFEQPGIEDQIKQFLLQILKEFSNQYLKQLPELRPILNEMSEFPEKCSTKPDDIMNRFKDFEKIAENLKSNSKL